MARTVISSSPAATAASVERNEVNLFIWWVSKGLRDREFDQSFAVWGKDGGVARLRSVADGTGDAELAFSGRFWSCIPSARLEQEAQILGLREEGFGPIGSAQQKQTRGFISYAQILWLSRFIFS